MPFPWNEQSIPDDFISPHEIVVASDLSDIEELLPHVSAQARACKARVTLVYGLEFSIGRHEQELEEELYARQILGQAKQALEMDGVPSSVVVRKGEAAEVVETGNCENKGGTTDRRNALARTSRPKHDWSSRECASAYGNSASVRNSTRDEGVIGACVSTQDPSPRSPFGFLSRKHVLFRRGGARMRSGADVPLHHVLTERDRISREST